MQFPFEDRLSSVRKIVKSHPVDGMLFTSLETIRYLSGFTGSDAALVVTPKESFFLTDSRYWTQADEEVKASKIVHTRRNLTESLLSCRT